jgi:uncharacterized membrane protein
MTTPSMAPGRPRIVALDIIRGAVMVLMAIDHVRVYSGVPAGGPTPGVFFTRWITHFCAPAFVFLAGTAAFFYGQKIGSKNALTRFLVIRGAWLILLELTLLRFAWTFNLDYAHYLLAGVIWMLGWCMILLGVLVRLPLAALTVLGAAIVGLHNLTDFFPGLQEAAMKSGAAGLWKLLYFGGELGPLAVLYVIVPWIGVMALGYSFGSLFQLPPARRRKLCLTIGGGAIALFLVLRGFNLYGDPRPWSPTELLSFLRTNKYPASLLFLLMTLGPTIALVPTLERAKGWWGQALAVFGRVPFFYYLLHIPLIHALAILVAKIRTPEAVPWLFENHPMWMSEAPPGYQWSLPLLYLVFAVAIVLLYFPCRWFAELKARRSDTWLRYL